MALFKYWSQVYTVKVALGPCVSFCALGGALKISLCEFTAVTAF